MSDPMVKCLTWSGKPISRRGKPQKGQRLTTTKSNHQSGRSAVAAAAYAAGVRLYDHRQGITHDYRAKGGVFTSFIVGGGGWTDSTDRERLWNMAELANKACNARTAMEWVCALPHELSHAQRVALLREISTMLADRYRVIVDASLHIPNKEGDQRNHHAHILMTHNRVNADGSLGEKVRELTDKNGGKEIFALRAEVERLMNVAMAAAGRPERVDLRNLKAQGVDRKAQKHVGINATNAARRNYLTDAEHAGQVTQRMINERAGLVAAYPDAEKLRHIREQIAANDKALATIAANPVRLPKAGRAFTPRGIRGKAARSEEAFIYRTFLALIEKLARVLPLPQIAMITAHAVEHRAQQAQRAAAIRAHNRALRVQAKAVLARLMKEQGTKGRAGGARPVAPVPVTVEEYPTPPAVAATLARKNEQRRRPQQKPPARYQAKRTRPQKARFDHMRAAKKNPHSPKSSPRS